MRCRSRRSRAGRSVEGKRAWRVRRGDLAAVEGGLLERVVGGRVENVWRREVRKARGVGRGGEGGGCGCGCGGGGGIGEVQGLAGGWLLGRLGLWWSKDFLKTRVRIFINNFSVIVYIKKILIHND